MDYDYLRAHHTAAEMQAVNKEAHYNDVWLKVMLVSLPALLNLGVGIQAVKDSFDIADTFMITYKERVEGQKCD